MLHWGMAVTWSQEIIRTIARLTRPERRFCACFTNRRMRSDETNDKLWKMLRGSAIGLSRLAIASRNWNAS
jgi:hypothetical protein